MAVKKIENKFSIGDVVYLKSDLQFKIPMTITDIETCGGDNEYHCEWFTPQKQLQASSFNENTLQKEL